MTGQADVIVVTEDAERSRDVISGIEPYHDVGHVALEALQPEVYPNCLLYVIDCPDLDRTAVGKLQSLQDHPGFAAVPCIYILSTLSRRDVVRVSDLGAADYFVRPIDARKFVKSMSKHITGAVERSWEKLGEIERAALKVSLKSFEDAFSAFGEGRPPDTEAIKESSNMVVEAVGAGGAGHVPRIGAQS
jgi:DNA-binding response OmpR family regulator